jgi:hypothetical protein
VNVREFPDAKRHAFPTVHEQHRKINVFAFWGHSGGEAKGHHGLKASRTGRIDMRRRKEQFLGFGDRRTKLDWGEVTMRPGVAPPSRGKEGPIRDAEFSAAVHYEH